MKLGPSQTIYTDVLVIGSGGAGLRASIEARRRGAETVLVSKSRVGYGDNTVLSGAGIAACLGKPELQDTPEAHMLDTLAAGRFVNDQRLVDAMVRGAGREIQDLESFGVEFHKRDGELVLMGPIAGHSHPRILHPTESGGIHLSKPMRGHAAKIGVRFQEHALITRLLKSGQTVVGALGVDREGKLLVIKAKATVLATGGLGQVYLRSDNALGATGDGFALAYEAGVALKDMEFIQFYPTRRAEHNAGPGITGVIYEHVVITGGAIIRNSLGEDILVRHGLTDRQSITRDVVSRAVMTEISEGRDVSGAVLVDCTDVSAETWQRLRKSGSAGIPPERGIFRVAPAALFCMGGIEINEDCETALDGLFAAGEAAAGVHGANRLAGNAMIEIYVAGSIAGGRAAERAQRAEPALLDKGELAAEIKRLEGFGSPGGNEKINDIQTLLKETMWQRAGIIRSEESLREALKVIATCGQRLQHADVRDHRRLAGALSLESMLTVSEMICRAALQRTESRGAHYRSDYPDEDNGHWLKNTVLSKHRDEMALSLEDVDLAFMKPEG